LDLVRKKGQDQEDKWSRRKVDQNQPSNPDIHSLFLRWTRTVPTKTRDTNCNKTNTNLSKKNKTNTNENITHKKYKNKRSKILHSTTLLGNFERTKSIRGAATFSSLSSPPLFLAFFMVS
jgi:hypothetical protein